jgi:TolB-like protein/Tfp pilus assembly protein PilF
MASLIPGFEYDIFISYRQKDNKGDRWVSDFVEALKTELESTLKDEISVYFDINPHDGLLETHDVNASLKEKLKCLVFIPVISHTYCDPRSFAWQYEFVAFIKIAKEDQFGRDIRLAGGNVASRILPVKIHDLDTEDKKLLENELGSVLRSVEFIYKTPGVNRPLRAIEDHPQDNLNKTYYRDQINKVANAIKEIITAIKKYDQNDAQVSNEVFDAKPVLKKNLKTKIIAGSLLILVFIVLGLFLIPKLSHTTGSDVTSLTVLPFENTSNDKENAWLADGIKQDLMLQLYNLNSFIVRSHISSNFQYKGTEKTIAQIGKELNADYWITGSVERDSNKIIVRVCLNNTETNTQLALVPFECSWENLQNAQAELTRQIADKLNKVLSPVEIRRINRKMTEEPKAYQLYSQGISCMKKPVPEIFKAIELYDKAIELDPKFCMAYMMLSECYSMLYNLNKRPDILEKSIGAIDSAKTCDPEVVNMPSYHIALYKYYIMGFQDYAKAMEELNTAEKLADYKSSYPNMKSMIYRPLGEWKLAKENFLMFFEQAPTDASAAHNAAVTLSLLGEYEEAEKYFKSAIDLSPTYFQPYWQWIYMDMKWKGNTIRGRETLAEAFQFKELINNPLLVESKVLMDIYDGNYESAISYLSSKKLNSTFGAMMYVNHKALLYARLYNLMNMPEKANAYYDSARIALDSLSLKNPDDSRYYSALGIAYAGLGLKGKAIEAGAKGVELLPMNKDAYLGVYRIEDLARIYVMVGEYDKALVQIKFLLSHPSLLSVKMLQLDPVWKPLREMPEFKKMIRRAPSDDDRI